ncbi:uncharacterized protein EV422DRAFT_123028 [Fimicolochytrium jonesii]|uniref:uncharacterized protein n=1 Tax=Fimicolochytrium jonesii TaxID=1396493 RepID=UPI0022FEFBEF|nr:uncharacterized protein EV422DRAFT_123028 [Fimicolochytrium jonesii]KAI8819256.1 hypothetical protein EV422DRAFT_123028 [Fimicolochytrium jonesii]
MGCVGRSDAKQGLHRRVVMCLERRPFGAGGPTDCDIHVLSSRIQQVVPFAEAVYASAPQDWDHQVVKRLITERRLAPFYKGLSDAEEAEKLTAEAEAAASKQSATASSSSIAANNPQMRSPVSSPTGTPIREDPPTLIRSASRATAINKRTSMSAADLSKDSWGRRISHERQGSISSFSLKGKRSASLPNQLVQQQQYLQQQQQQQQQQQEEVSLIPLEGLYKWAVECPICFLYYPSNINYSRCCDQPICTECFVQIKRSESTLEPAACPFCVETNFGILYYTPGSPEHEKKLLEAHPDDHAAIVASGHGARMDYLAARRASAISTASGIPGDGTSSSTTDKRESTGDLTTTGSPTSETGPSDFLVPPTTAPAPFKRRASVSHKSALVVTSDELRPDWLRKQQQLALVRAANQRRHTISSLGSNGGTRRVRHLFLENDRDLASAAAAAAGLVESMTGSEGGGAASATAGDSAANGRARGARGDSSRRRARTNADMGFNYIEAMRNMGADLEELMLMEAIRRSLAESEANAAEATNTSGTSAENNTNAAAPIAESTTAAAAVPPLTAVTPPPVDSSDTPVVSTSAVDTITAPAPAVVGETATPDPTSSSITITTTNPDTAPTPPTPAAMQTDPVLTIAPDTNTHTTTTTNNVDSTTTSL